MSTESERKLPLHTDENPRGKVRSEMKERARKLRREPAPGEAELWERLRGGKLGFRFRRKAVVRGWIADFWCPAKRLVVAIDGGSRRPERKDADGAIHDKALDKKFDVRTLRVPLRDVLENLDKVVNLIRVEMDCRTTGYLHLGKLARERRPGTR